ncbi:hypothetical protein CFC21_066436 [Triticum aestivum]|uniref:Barwin domain-containing protein n=3 Tax=Triticum TaxID=4564 RepID=A0A9R0WQB6_TRITD|nr:hypothetical protein CFC21_066436 [Triticum aestivum]VAI19114.1 unnamed protein product [Triticum turgidum subsp. durum]
MANAAKAAAILLVFLQVACAVARHHADPRASFAYVETSGVMMLSGFDQGEERAPASCSGTYHTDLESVITVSSKIYTSGGLCGIMFRITDMETGRSAMAEAVDECHDCRDDEVGASAGVWKDLGLDTTGAGLVDVMLSY